MPFAHGGGRDDGGGGLDDGGRVRRLRRQAAPALVAPADLRQQRIRQFGRRLRQPA
jgi:hypothetical protein